MKGIIFSVLVSVLVLNIGLALGLNCYMCSKINGTGPNKDCDHATTIKPDATECKATGTGVAMCTRTTAKIQVDGKDVNYIIRDCFKGTDVQGCVEVPPGGHSNFSVPYQYCTCKTDKCNGNGDPFANPASKIGLAHFSLPLIGIALRQALAFL